MDVNETLRCAKILIDSGNYEGAKSLLNSIPRNTRNSKYYYLLGIVNSNLSVDDYIDEPLEELDDEELDDEELDDEEFGDEDPEDEEPEATQEPNVPQKSIEETIKEYEKKFPRKKDCFKNEEAKYLNQISSKISKAFKKCSDVLTIDLKKMSLESFVFVCALKASDIYTRTFDQNKMKSFISRARNILYDQKEIGKITKQELQWLNNRLNEYLYLIFEDSFSNHLGKQSLGLMDAFNIIEKYNSDPSGRCSLFFLDCVCIEILDGRHVGLPFLRTTIIRDLFDSFEVSPLICDLLDEIENAKEKISMGVDCKQNNS